MRHAAWYDKQNKNKEHYTMANMVFEIYHIIIHINDILTIFDTEYLIQILFWRKDTPQEQGTEKIKAKKTNDINQNKSQHLLRFTI